MTFFLKDYNPVAAPPKRGPDAPTEGFLSGLGAATSQAMRDTNANFLRQREVLAERQRMAEEAGKRLGYEKVFPQQAPGILAMARKEAKIDPKKWADIDLTDEGMQARVTERRIAEDRDEQATLEMMPSGRGLAEFVGSMAGGLADVRNAPFMLAGGGGSFLRVLGREAFLNMAAETVTFPSQVETAAELGKPEPNLLETLVTAAVAGAVLGGAVDGVSRGISYYRGRQAVKGDPLRQTAAVDAAEDALVTGQNPIIQADRALRELDPEVGSGPYDAADMAPAPLIPPEAFEDAPPASPEAPAAASTPLAALLPPQTPDALPDAVTGQLDAIEAEADAVQQRATGGWKFPVLTSMRKSGMRIDPATPDGAELYQILGGPKAANRSLPGLFKKGAMDGRGFDNMPAADWESRFPGIIEATGTARDATYLDRDGVLELLRRESGGDHTWMHGVQEANAIRSTITSQAIDDFVAMQPGEHFVPLGSDAFAAIDTYLSSRGMRILDREREAIADQLTARGGDLEILLEVAMSRQLDDFEYAILRGEIPDDTGRNAARTEGPTPDDAGTGGGAFDEPQVAGSDAARGGTGGAQYQGNAFPGTDRIQTGVAQAQKAEIAARALQSKIRRLDQNRVEDGAGNLFSEKHADLFDDPSGAKARPIQDQMIEDLRDLGDMTFDIDGKRTAASLADEIEADDEFQAVLDACAKPRVNP